jgi:hypothetical protein
MFKEIDLSKAVRSNTVAITFRYQITSCINEGPHLAWLADSAQGENPILLAGDSGHVTVRLRTSQRLYYKFDSLQFHLNLWIVECKELGKHSG